MPRLVLYSDRYQSVMIAVPHSPETGQPANYEFWIGQPYEVSPATANAIAQAFNQLLPPYRRGWSYTLDGMPTVLTSDFVPEVRPAPEPFPVELYQGQPWQPPPPPPTTLPGEINPFE